MNKLAALPPDSRCWLFLPARELTSEEHATILSELSDLLADWNAHGTPLNFGADFVFNRFLVLAVDSSLASASGCSIDRMFHVVESVFKQAEISLLRHDTVFFEANGKIIAAPSNEFKLLVGSGEIKPDTPVFDTTAQKLSDLEHWRLPFAESWHAKRFSVSHASEATT